MSFVTRRPAGTVRGRWFALRYRVFAASLLVLGPAPGFGLFSGRSYGVKPMSLGDAYAGGGDSSALLWNPAGSATSESMELVASFGRFLPGAAGASLGSGLLSYLAPAGPYTRVGVFASLFNADGLLREITVGAHMARVLSRRVRAGVTAKVLSADYLVSDSPEAAGNPAFASGSRVEGVAADVGFQFDASSERTFGAFVRNLGEPDVGLLEESRVPVRYQAGIRQILGRARVYMDLSREDAASGRSRWNAHVGSEWAIPIEDGRTVFLRFGINGDAGSAGAGVEIPGIGRALAVDYAVRAPWDLASEGGLVHRAAVSLRF